MAAPGSWGEPSYPSYPHGHPHSPPDHRRVLHPYAAVAPPQRHSFYAPPPPPPAPQSHAIPGFYNPALSQAHHPSLTPGVVHSSPPVFPEPRIGLPPSLVPGRQPAFAVPRSQSKDYFFQQNEHPHRAPPLRHAQSVPNPPLPRKPDFTQPPLPPKPPFSLVHPSISPSSDPGPSRSPVLFSSPEPTPAGPPPPPFAAPTKEHDPDDDAIFNRILAMSAQEAQRSSQSPGLSEDEQIARALEESLRINPAQSVPSPVRSYSVVSASPEQNPSVNPATSMPVPDLDIGAGVAAPAAPSSSSSSRPPLGHHGGTQSHSIWAEQISADEALARQLAEEEERLMQQEEEEESRRHAEARSASLPPTHAVSLPAPSAVANASGSPNAALPGDAPFDGPPQYDDAVSSPPPASGAFYSSSLSGHFSPNGIVANGAGPSVSRPGTPSRMQSLGRSVSEKPVSPTTKSYEPTDDSRPLGRSQSLGSSSLAPTTPPGRRLSFASSELDIPDDNSIMSSVSAPIPQSSPEIAPNAQTQYLDPELLLGLSMDFGFPPISAEPKRFEGVIPNVISLPYGRCPPFHIRATSWRTLLKLLARLSGSHLEPTVEAQALVKTEMRLRVVVSFVKVHHASSVWHTVLYMTIDHPVPPSSPMAYKYKNGDTGTLPWSYTLSQTPAIFRDGPEALMSKYYTIPPVNESPYPALPISFPNLATYLASALETSRNAMHDSSSGVRRLARCVDQFYPSDHIGVLDDAPEKAGMRQRLKNLVGIGSKPQRDRNADVYELVTPFVPDQYGH